MDDFETLEKELEALEGFVVASRLEITVQYANKEKAVRLFRLDRKVKSLSHNPLSNSAFEVSGALTKVKTK